MNQAQKHEPNSNSGVHTLKRNRAAFLALIFLALIVLASVVMGRLSSGVHQDPASPAQVNAPDATATLAATTTATTRATLQPTHVVLTTATAVAKPADAPTVTATVAATEVPTPAQGAALTATAALTKTPEYQIIRGPNYKPNDGLPTFQCITYSNGSYFIPQLIQMTGLDVQNGFHLSVAPLDLNVNVTDEAAAELVRDGTMDCTLTTLDSVAVHNPGAITAIIDESAGTDQIWARNVPTINDLKGKKIAVGDTDSTEFLALYAIDAVGLVPGKDVTLVRMDGLDAQLKAFEEGKVDAVSGWEPTILEAEKFGGRRLLSTRDFRAVVDVVVTSRKSIAERPEVVTSFHKAWFMALSLLSRDFDRSAKLIANWGNNDYTGISKNNAADDFRGQLATIAQADLAQNVRLMKLPNAIYDRLTDMRQLWRKSGVDTPLVPVQVDPSFVLRTADDFNKRDLPVSAKFINRTFSWGQTPQTPSAVPTATASALAGAPTSASTADSSTPVGVLPCSRFDFAPNSIELLKQSRDLLDACVVRTMRQTVGVVLRLRGSSAWPGPKGRYSQAQVEQMARTRAQAVASYLATKGIDPKRLVVEAVLPPQEHWQTDDVLQQAQDRYVEMTLLVSGL